MSQVRSALVIATSHYADSALSQLRSPVQDAHALVKVLDDPAIGAFDVQSALNQPEAQLRRELGRFFGNRGRSDLLLVYISCHGLKDDDGQLYFATTDTERENLGATAISSEFINQQMTRSRSQRVILVLDCCYSGAFVRGVKGPGIDLDLGERFQGRGRVVITSSGSLEYAFEAEGPTDKPGQSVFTKAFVQGLETGEADLDQDGLITVAELYDYVYKRVRESTP